jgi:hypothetical protein
MKTFSLNNNAGFRIVFGDDDGSLADDPRPLEATR